MQLIYITNDPARACAAQAAGVDQLMVDLEINGKVERQRGLNTVISNHMPEDISALRRVLDRSDLLVRVNPMFDGSAAEIDDAIARGANRLMLPMFTTADEVQRFVELIDGRANAMLLLETPAALARLPDILAVAGIDCVHVGLNDLHLGLKLGFMFELLSDGVVADVAEQVRERGIRFGFGGVARLDEGLLSARLILSEHVRLGSEQVILSRDFGRIFDDAAGPQAAAETFAGEVRKVRAHVAELARATPQDLLLNQQLLRDAVRTIASRRAS